MACQTNDPRRHRRQSYRRQTDLDHDRHPCRWLKLIGASYEDDSQDSHRIGNRIVRICFHRDARIGPTPAAATILPVILSRRDGLQLHKLCTVRGDGFRPVRRML